MVPHDVGHLTLRPLRDDATDDGVKVEALDLDADTFNVGESQRFGTVEWRGAVFVRMVGFVAHLHGVRQERLLGPLVCLLFGDDETLARRGAELNAGALLQTLKERQQLDALAQVACRRGELLGRKRVPLERVSRVKVVAVVAVLLARLPKVELGDERLSQAHPLALVARVGRIAAEQVVKVAHDDGLEARE